jgi:negative regulator of replication initiation
MSETDYKVPSTDKKDEDILQEARDRFRLCQDYNSEITEAAIDDLRFFKGEQWDADAIKERSNDRRPSLTINKLPATCQQVVNSIRQNRPSIKIRPVDSVTDPKTADVIQGIIRNIQASNDVKSALDTALEYAVICSIGYLRVYTDYISSDSMDQEIIIERIDNPLAVHFPIPLCHAADWSDAPYCFVRTSMSKDEYKNKYGEKAADEILNWDSGSSDPNWTEEKIVWLAEYFTVQEEYKTLYQLSDGTTTFDKPDPTAVAINELGQMLPGPQIIKERKTCVKKVMWYLMSEKTILESQEFPCSYIPVIPVLGWELSVDGKKSYMSLIRHAKDPQKLYNYYKSMEAEIISLAPKAPWIVAAGQIEGFEDSWKVANTKSQAYLEYNQVDARGQVAPAPQRVNPPQVPTAAVQGMRESADDIKSTTGIYDASLGAQGNESSGRAIIARQKMGDNATWHYQDSLTRAVRQMGRIIVDLIPKVYDVPRSVRILGEDMADDIVMVNQMHYSEEEGENVLYDLSVGRYDVTVDVGPSYESKRIETAENLTNIIQAIPHIGQVASDILVRNLDFPGAQELSDRLKRTIPPNLLEDPNSKPNKISDSEVQMIVQDLHGLQQQLQMAGQEKQEMLGVIKRYESLLKDKEADRQVKMATETMRSQTAMRTQQAKLMQERMKNEQEDEMATIDMAMKLSQSRMDAGTNLSDRYQPTGPETEDSE